MPTDRNRGYSERMRFVHVLVMAAISVIYGLAGVINFKFAPSERYWNLSTSLDEIIPFEAAFAWPYLSYYLLLGTPLLLVLPVNELRHLWRQLAWASALSAVLFLLMPTQPPRPDFISSLSGLSAWVVQAIYMIDPPSNCFPSLHVLHSGLIALFYLRRPSTHAWGLVFCAMALGVCFATVFIKQHFAVDVIAALLLIPLVDRLSRQELPLAVRRLRAP